MSLDVYLRVPDRLNADNVREAIFIRRDGRTAEITRREWQQLMPGVEPVTVMIADDETVYHGNVTHNLVPMASEVDLYQVLWRPEEIKISTAADLIDPLQAGLDRLRADPDTYRAFNPPNGWGNYEGFVRFIEEYLAAARDHPKATVSVSR